MGLAGHMTDEAAGTVCLIYRLVNYWVVLFTHTCTVHEVSMRCLFFPSDVGAIGFFVLLI